jgi:hypothetical protein
VWASGQSRCASAEQSQYGYILLISGQRQAPSQCEQYGNWWRLIGFVLILTLAEGAAVAASVETTLSEPGALSAVDQRSKSATACESGGRATDVVTNAQRQLETIGCRLAFWVDGIGGETASVKAARRTEGELRFIVSYSQQSSLDLKIKGRLDAELPFLQRRVKAFIGREGVSEVDNDSSVMTGNRFSEETAASEWLIGLGFGIPQFRKIKSDFRVGLRSLSLPKLFAQATAEAILVDTPISLGNLMVKPFWNNRDGFGLTVRAIYSRALSGRRHNFFRLAEVLTVTDETMGLSWRSGLSLFQRVNYRTGLVWRLYAAGETEAPEPLGVYGASVSYRRPVGKVISVSTLSYEFPRETAQQSRDESVGLTLEFTLPFGR